MVDLITYFNDVEGNMCLRINRLSHNGPVCQLFSAVSKLGDGGYWAACALVLY